MSGEAAARGRPGSPEPTALERQNLLASLQERRQREAQGRFPLHRLLVLARLGPRAAAPEVAGYYRELFENGLEDHAREPVSGLLLVCPSYMCHVVESCTSTIHLIIQDLASIQNQGHSALLQEVKVLVVTHDIPTRLFPDWYVATATSPTPSPQGWPESQPTEEVVAECLTFLLKLAACIQRSESSAGFFCAAIRVNSPTAPTWRQPGEVPPEADYSVLLPLPVVLHSLLGTKDQLWAEKGKFPDLLTVP